MIISGQRCSGRLPQRWGGPSRRDQDPTLCTGRVLGRPPDPEPSKGPRGDRQQPPASVRKVAAESAVQAVA